MLSLYFFVQQPFRNGGSVKTVPELITSKVPPQAVDCFFTHRKIVAIGSDEEDIHNDASI
jgi:hypothetical protein